MLQQARMMDQLKLIASRRTGSDFRPALENAALLESITNRDQPSRRLRVPAARVVLKVNVVDEVAEPVNYFRMLSRGSICPHLSVSSSARRFEEVTISRDVCRPGSPVSGTASPVGRNLAKRSGRASPTARTHLAIVEELSSHT